MKRFQPKILYIEKSLLNHPIAESIIEKLPGVEMQTIDNYQQMGLKHLPVNTRFKLENQCFEMTKGMLF